MYILPAITNNIYHQTNVRSSSLRQSYPNLAPLARDTVSFTSGKKEAGNPEDGIDINTATQINKEASQSYKYLAAILNTIFDDMVMTKYDGTNSDKPIKCIKSRIKDPESICEKSATLKLNSAKEVKSEITDIVGARVVMSDTSVKAVDSVIGKLTDAVKDHKIKIIEIENYRPEPEYNDYDEIVKTYDYASPVALRRLKKACDENCSTSIRKSDEDQPSGYMAIHMLVQLPNGFIGEIQIIGDEVERLKDIEDMCFKVKNGKHLKKKYAPVESMILANYDRNDEITRREYNIYTRKAYIYQREIEESGDKNNKNQDFLHIPEYLPQALDFNNVAELVQKCRSLYFS